MESAFLSHILLKLHSVSLSQPPPPPPNQLLSVQDLSSDLIETHHYIAVFQRDIIVDYFVSLPLGFVLLGS